jgi:hypothetical protein
MKKNETTPAISAATYRSVRIRTLDYEAQLRLAERRGITWTEWARGALYIQCCLQLQADAEEKP